MKLIKIEKQLALIDSSYCSFRQEFEIDQPLLLSNESNSFKIHQILENALLISIKLPLQHQLKIGSKLVADLSGPCLLEINKLYGEYATAETRNCSTRHLITLKTVLFPLKLEQKLQKEYIDSLPPNTTQKIIRQLKAKSWFTFWGLGVAKNTMDGPAGAIAFDGKGRKNYSFDVLGIYFPLANNRMLMGFVTNLVLDKFKYTDTSDQTYDLSYLHVMPSFSTLYFITDLEHQGWFLRGDIGASKYYISQDGPSSLDQENSSIGLGYLLGGGYSWQIPWRDYHWNLLLHANYAHRNVNTSTHSIAIDTFTLSLGAIF